MKEANSPIRDRRMASPRSVVVVLIGFMGVGKSTVGAKLAGLLGWTFVDSDQSIEARISCSIAEYFKVNGEDAFRRVEAEVIEELSDRRNIVLALGGGSFDNGSTRERLLGSLSTLVVHLLAPLEVSMNRCERQQGAALRPLLRHKASLRERLESRLPYYEMADLNISTHERTPDAVAEQIAEYLMSKAT